MKLLIKRKEIDTAADGDGSAALAAGGFVADGRGRVQSRTKKVCTAKPPLMMLLLLQ